MHEAGIVVLTPCSSCHTDLLVSASPQNGRTPLHYAALLRCSHPRVYCSTACVRGGDCPAKALVVLLGANEADQNAVDKVRREDACMRERTRGRDGGGTQKDRDRDRETETERGKKGGWGQRERERERERERKGDVRCACVC